MALPAEEEEELNLVELLEKGHVAWMDELDSSDEDPTWQPDSDVTQDQQELDEEELEEEELEQGEQQAAQQTAPRAAQQTAPQATLQAQLGPAVPPPGLPTGDVTGQQPTAPMSLPSLRIPPPLPAIPILPNQQMTMPVVPNPSAQQHQQQLPPQLGQGVAHHLAAGSAAGQAGAADLADLQPQAMGGVPLQGVARQGSSGDITVKDAHRLATTFRATRRDFNPRREMLS